MHGGNKAAHPIGSSICAHFAGSGTYRGTRAKSVNQNTSTTPWDSGIPVDHGHNGQTELIVAKEIVNHSKRSKNPSAAMVERTFHP